MVYTGSGIIYEAFVYLINKIRNCSPLEKHTVERAGVRVCRSMQLLGEGLSQKGPLSLEGAHHSHRMPGPVLSCPVTSEVSLPQEADQTLKAR